MSKVKNSRVIELTNAPSVISSACCVGKTESEGPLQEYFDICFPDDGINEKTWEAAESRLMNTAISRAIEKAGIDFSDIGIIFAGDLMNQCTSSTYAVRSFSVPFAGIFGACSTMAYSIALSSLVVNSGYMSYSVAATSSHFCSAEKQFRYPLEYGSQKTPSAQRTVTGSGAFVIGSNIKDSVTIKKVLFGKVTDLGILDTSNMGAAMAPDDVKIRPYPTHEGMVFFYTQIQYLRGLRALFKDFLTQKIVEKSVNEIRKSSSIR